VVINTSFILFKTAEYKGENYKFALMAVYNILLKLAYHITKNINFFKSKEVSQCRILENTIEKNYLKIKM